VGKVQHVSPREKGGRELFRVEVLEARADGTAKCVSVNVRE